MQEGYIPEKWFESTLKAISKPVKEPTNPSKCRPIALTSFICKITEIRVNVKLLDFFDQKGTFLTLHSGGGAKRTTIYHLLSLEATVRMVQANG